MIISDELYILKPFVTYTVTKSDGSLYDAGTFYVAENTTTSLTMNWLITSCFNELNYRYAEVGSSIATGNDYLIQHIGN